MQGTKKCIARIRTTCEVFFINLSVLVYTKSALRARVDFDFHVSSIIVDRHQWSILLDIGKA